jgi:predicted RNA-binding protein YlqC (UPF0109 family)
MSRARDLVELIARALADGSEELTVTEEDRRGTTHVEVSSRSGDLGKLIGRQGRTAAAVRTLAALAGEIEGRRVTVDFVDVPSGSR